MDASTFHRFFEKVLVGDSCWEWTNGCFWNGYGAFKMRHNGRMKQRKAHIVSFEHFYHMTVPTHLRLLHTCDNPKCVNPYHLELGTQADNLEDMRRKGRGKNGYSWKVDREIKKMDKHIKDMRL